MAVYSIELYNSQNATQTLVADITTMCESVRYVVPLNNFEELSFSLNLEAWKEYCSLIGIDPYSSIRPLTAEIKLKRDGVYLPFTFEIKSAAKNYTARDSSIQIQARGTLSKLGDRIITKTYAATDATAIARDIIADSQAKLYGNFGITNGNLFYTGVLTDRTYERYNCMDAIRNLSDDASGGFDFYFDHDWKFYTMSKRGSTWTDIVYSFGGEGSNSIEYQNPEDGTFITNALTIVGEGIGDPLLNTPASGLDVTSALTYGLREKALIYSNISNQAWLDAKAASELVGRKDVYDLPTITLLGDVFDLNEKWVGDTIQLACIDEASPYTGNGRIKSLTVSLDNQHNEVIKLECLKV